jgi:hypothetical protein
VGLEPGTQESPDPCASALTTAQKMLHFFSFYIHYTLMNIHDVRSHDIKLMNKVVRISPRVRTSAALDSGKIAEAAISNK